jgi:hypothetical protein
MKILYLLTITHTFDEDYKTIGFLTKEEAIQSMNEMIDNIVQQQQKESGYTPYVQEINKKHKKLFYMPVEDVEYGMDYIDIRILETRLDANTRFGLVEI